MRHLFWGGAVNRKEMDRQEGIGVLMEDQPYCLTPSFSFKDNFQAHVLPLLLLRGVHQHMRGLRLWSSPM